MSSMPPLAATDALRSVHTSNLPALFAELQVSLVVSTYQAGKVILVRNDEGGCSTPTSAPSASPWGSPPIGARLTIGGTNTVWYYRNMPAVAAKLEPAGKHDACYLPRRIHVTGDIDIHEIAWIANDELWLVNTRFGCLCTLDADHSFYPRWRPPFLSRPRARGPLPPERARHGRRPAQYVTALGETDTPGGWRANKAQRRAPDGHRDQRGPDARACRCRTRRAGTRASCGCWSPARAASPSSIPSAARGGRWRRCPASPAAWTSTARWPSSACRRSARPPSSAASRSSSGCGSAPVAFGSCTSRRARRWVFCASRRGCRRSSRCRCCRGSGFPELLEWNDERLAHSYVLPDEALALVKLPSPEELARSPAFHFQHGTKSYHEGKLAEAIAAYRECLRLGSGLSQCPLQPGRGPRGCRGIRGGDGLSPTGVEAEPERPETYNSLGYLTNRQHRPEEAIAALRARHRITTRLCPGALQPGHDAPSARRLPAGSLRVRMALADGPVHALRLPPSQMGRAPHPRSDPVDPYRARRRRCHSIRALSNARGRALPEIDPGVPGRPDAAVFDDPRHRRAARGRHHPGLGVRHLLSLAEPAAGLRHDLGNHPEPRALPRHRDGAQAQDAIDIAGRDPTRRIGIVWAGSPTYRNDRHRSIARLRSPADPAAPGHRFLQPAEGRALPGPPGLPPDCAVQDLEPSLADFGDTALAIDALDLLITVDTAVAHLAGALGKPVWTLLSEVPDWRWGLTAQTTPWYPSMRLFRQDRGGDWAAVIERISEALAGMLNTWPIDDVPAPSPHRS